MIDKPIYLRPWVVKPDKNSEVIADTSKFIMPPQIIYRYVTISRAKQILANKKLWFSSPNSFNDPFDLHQGLVDFSINMERAKEFANRNRAGQPRSIRRAFAKDAVKRQKELIAYQKELFETTKASSGVCYFSKRSDVALMWSHYADSHKGIAIGFNIEPVYTDFNQFFFVQPVRYIDEIRALNYYDRREETLMHWVLTKSAVWAYEQEVRAFCLNQNGLISFDPKCVKEIYFGCNSTQSDIDEILKQTTGPGYKDIIAKKMVINPKTFNIKPVTLNV